MKLNWPDFQLECARDGHLVFNWPKFCRIQSNAHRCVSLRLVPQSSDGACQWIFQLRDTERTASGLVVVRVDVPPDRVRDAKEVTELLLRRYAIPDHQDEKAEEAELERVPMDAQEWIVTPASPASEELFRDVMVRIVGDTG